MKKLLSILLLFSICSICEVTAQTDSDFKATEVQLNDSVAVRIRRIPKGAYIPRKQASEQLLRKPYEKITGFEKVKERLGNKLKIVELTEINGENEYTYTAAEITFDDGTKDVVECDPPSVTDIYSYYPKLNIVTLLDISDGDVIINLSGGDEKFLRGDPRFHSLSPNGKLRINGYHPGGAYDHPVFFIEIWDKTKGRWRYFADITEENRVMQGYFTYANNWFWTDNNTVLCNTPHDDYYEMKIIPTQKAETND